MTPAGSDPVDALPLADLRRVVSALVAQVATLQDAGDQHMALLALKDAEIAAAAEVQGEALADGAGDIEACGQEGAQTRPWLLARQLVGDVGGEAQGGSAAGLALAGL